MIASTTYHTPVCCLRCWPIRQYCPHPASWLNAQRWRDDQATWSRNGNAEVPKPEMTEAERRKAYGYS